MPAWAEALALGEGDQAGWLTQRLHLVRREMGSVSAHTQRHPPLWQREGWMWCGRTDLLVLGHATDLPWAPKRGPVTLSFSPKTPLLSKACGHIIGTAGRGRSWQDRRRHMPMCLNAWTFIYFKEATEFAHIMHGSLCYTVRTIVLTHNEKATQQAENLKAHCTVQQQRWSLPTVGNSNAMELITNRIKTN